jgi:DNA-binding transcriptional MerR regulator
MRPTETEIPDKRYFRIGEVSALTGLETYVLRYWETEFPEIKPVRSRAGQRLYRKKDIETVFEIKDLLHGKRFTIAGAKQYLKARRQVADLRGDDNQPITLEKLREELLAIRELLGES